MVVYVAISIVKRPTRRVSREIIMIKFILSLIYGDHLRPL
jgi:hypothetical protein